jgi:hypothetical protein
MKAKTWVLLSALGGALLLSGCSTINSRINEKGAVFYDLDADTRAKIQHGDVGIGFTPDMVYIALGKPDAKRYRTTADGTTETWSYGTYYQNTTGYVGYHRWGGWGPRGMYRMYWEPVYAPMHRSRYSEQIRVTFRDGKVSSIEQSRR